MILGSGKNKPKRYNETEEPLSFMKMVSLLTFTVFPKSRLTKPVFIAGVM